MATSDMRKQCDKNTGKPKKGMSTTDASSETQFPEHLQLLIEHLEQVVSLVEPAKEDIVQLWEQRSHHQDTSLEKLENQLYEAKNEQTKLEKKVKEMGRDKAELQQAKTTIQVLEKIQKEKNDTHIEEITAYKEVIRKTEELRIKAVEDLEETKHLLAKQEADYQKEIEVRSKEKSILAAALQNLKAEKDKLDTELSNTKTRLSKLMSDKLSDNNPDIADLSDENRPTKIGEKFQELYDNQWTDAFEVAEKHFSDKDEKTRIKILWTILMHIHKFCENEFSEQESALVQALYRTDKVVKEQLPLEIKSPLKDIKRRVAKEGIENITKKFLEAAFKTTQEINFIREVEGFVHECMMICWLMVLQDPPLAFHTDVRNGETFDSNIYKAFTVTGNKVDFLVWPPLLLRKNGSVLAKGIVQCKKDFDGSKSVRVRSRQVTASDIGIRTGSVRLTEDVKIETAKWLQDLGDSKNSTNEPPEEKVSTATTEKKSNNLRTATTESQCGSTNHGQNVQTTMDYRKNKKSSASGDQSGNSNRYQSKAGNVPQNQEYSQPHKPSQQVQIEAHRQFASDQFSDPQHQLQNTSVPSSQYKVVQQNQPTQSNSQPNATQSVTNASKSSASSQQHHLSQNPYQPNIVSMSEYPQHLIPTHQEWALFVYCIEQNMSEAEARYNIGALYDKCNDWRMFMAHNESHV